MEDVQLIDLFFARNEVALRETERSYGPYCTSIASRILPVKQDAEEVVNDVYLSLWNSIPPERPDNFKAYVAKITRNQALKKLQHETRKKRGGGVITESIDELAEVVPADGNFAEALEEKELAGCISRFLREQAPEKRKLFVQRYFYLLSIDELCRESGLKESNVKVTLMRMREKLQEYLQKEGYIL
ncbi:MAG: RNA polymerase sigma factor [Lachnospiraceae bacterium]|nr:RNA polymerase sigma factor [Lachnospiraceae bacterium]